MMSSPQNWRLSPNPPGATPCRGTVLLLATLLGGSSLMACRGRACLPPPLQRANTLQIEPGQVVSVRFGEPADSAPVCTTWTGARLNGSPLAYLMRPALILKADDYGGCLNRASQDFVASVQAVGGRASFGIITSRVTGDERALAAYQRLVESGHELWFHGHTHQVGPPAWEFSGASQERQEHAFAQGQEIAQRHFGFPFAAFGAPGNHIDDRTGRALLSSAAIKIWFFGAEPCPVLCLPRSTRVEETIGVMREPEQAVRSIDSAVENGHEVVVVQVHPWKFDSVSSERFDSLLRIVKNRRQFRFTTPSGWRQWAAERANLVIKKSAPNIYTIDGRKLAEPLALDFDPDLPLPTSLVVSTSLDLPCPPGTVTP